jgi:hypothetical protein
MHAVAQLAIAALLVASAAAVFPIIDGDGTKTMTTLANGSIHHRQTVNRVGLDGRYIRLHTEATHDAKWRFVSLTDYVTPAAFVASVSCDFAEAKDTVTIADAPANLTQAMEGHRGNEANVIVTAPGHLHCGGVAVFRQLVSAAVVDRKLVLTVSNTTYHAVLEHATARFETTHVDFKAPVEDEAEDETTEDATFNAAATAPDVVSRGMTAQHWGHHFFHHIGHIVHHVAKKVEHAAKHVAKVVKKAAKTVVKVVKVIATGDYSTDKDKSLLHGAFHKAVSKDNGHFTLNLAASFELKALFSIDIHHYKLEHTVAAMQGKAMASLLAEFKQSPSYSHSYTNRLADIKIHPISFAIGPIPVIIKPSIPIEGGIDVDVSTVGTVDVKADFAATIDLEYGFKYDHGFKPITTHKHTWTHSVTASKFDVKGSVYPYIRPSIVIDVDFIGGPAATLNLGAQLNLYADDDKPCRLHVSANVIAWVSLQATVGIDWKMVHFKKHTFGPWMAYQHTFPIFSKCLYSHPLKKTALPAPQGPEGVQGSERAQGPAAEEHVAKPSCATTKRRGFSAMSAAATPMTPLHLTLDASLTGMAFKGRHVATRVVPRACGAQPFTARQTSAQLLNVTQDVATLLLNVATTTTDGSMHTQMAYFTFPVVDDAARERRPIAVTMQLQRVVTSTIVPAALAAIPATLSGSLSGDLTQLALASPDMCTQLALSTAPLGLVAADVVAEKAAPTVVEVAGSAQKPVGLSGAAEAPKVETDRTAVVAMSAAAAFVAACVAAVLIARFSMKKAPRAAAADGGAAPAMSANLNDMQEELEVGGDVAVLV